MNPRGIFQHFFAEHGQTITVHNDWNTPNASSFETRALKNRKTDTKKDVFQLPERVDIRRGSILQIKGAQDLWRVVDTEDRIMSGQYVDFEVYIEKVDEKGEAIWGSSGTKAVFNAPVYGGVQMGGHKNTQNISIGSNSSIEEVVANLVEVLRASSLSELEKEDSIGAAQRLPQLSAKEQSSEVLNRAKSRLEIIKSAVEVSKEAGEAAAPILAWLFNHFSHTLSQGK